MRLLSEKLAAETHNKMGWQHNLLDVAVAYVSEINKSKTIKCLGYSYLGDIPLMGMPKQEHHFGVIDHDYKGTVLVK